jgi:phosphatidylglycerophosphate synthase
VKTTATTTDRIHIAVDGSGPRFLGLTTAERNRRVARRAEARHPQLAGTLRLPDDVALTGSMFDMLPREGTWHVAWPPDRPPLAWQAEGVVGPLRVIPVPDGSAYDVSSPAARRTSAWRLLRESSQPPDGWISTHVHRRVSRLFSYALLRFGLTAHHATLLTAALGLTGACLMAQTSHRTMIAAAFLFWCASIADVIGGEMARLSLSESSGGERRDTLVDHSIPALYYAGATIGWWRQGIGQGGIALSVCVGLVLAATLLFAMHLVRKASGSRQFFIDTKPVEFAVADAARTTDSQILRVAAPVLVMFRREVFPLAFAIAALASGWRGIYPTLVAASLPFVLLTLVFYVKPIEDAMRDRFATLAAS